MNKFTQYFVLIVNIIQNFAITLMKKYPQATNLLGGIAWKGTEYISIANDELKKRGIYNIFKKKQNYKNVLFIKDGVELKSSENVNEADLILMERMGDEKLNVMRFETMMELRKFELEQKEPILSKEVMILSPYIMVGEKSFQINLENNYLIEDNVLFDRPFIRYWLHRYHDYKLEENEDYKLTFFDNNMDLLEIKADQKLLIKDNNIRIS